jgi:hypothetical protein
MEDSLDVSRFVWMSLHAFEGATDRWTIRAAEWGDAGATDAQVRRAIVQEMGGPTEDAADLGTKGWWRDGYGFYFDPNGPLIVISRPGHRERTINAPSVMERARKLFRLDRAFDAPGGEQAPRRNDPSPSTDQLSFF